MQTHQVKFKLGEDEVTLETGKIGRQANGAIFATYGGTAVFCSAVASKKPTTGDYFPLSVNYTEKFYAAGKVPGGFIKREGRPKEKEILISRLTDRPMRPLFPEGFMHEVQVLPTTVSYDNVNKPDILAMIAAGASVSISDIPFDGSIGACRIGYIDGEFVVNPTAKKIEKSKLDLVVAGTNDAILMVEGHADLISEDEFLEAMKVAHEAIKVVTAAVDELVQKAGKPKMEYTPVLTDEDLIKEIEDFAFDKLKKASSNPDKMERYDSINEVFEETVSYFKEKEKTEEELSLIGNILHDIEKDIVRREILDDSIRPDGRKLDEIRKISIDLGLLPRVHGSALFTRGQTQAMAACTLGTAKDVQKIDDIEGNQEKYFMLHYNFPPFSVGEVGRVGFTGRREIGHGMLAERALSAVIPSENDFPYAIRLVSEIMESNGSSSMASVCGGCLAMMDAGVPIKSPVAGIAMGLVMDKGGSSYKILTDIQGVEDHLGDMDFKVTGTTDGITAFQMDIKVKGITFQIFEDSLAQAKKARLFILDKMKEVIEQPREEISQYAPKIVSLKIDPDKIGAVIGKGGETIRNIQDETETVINISDDGVVSIAAIDKNSADKALSIINGLTAEIVVGQIYEGTVKKIMPFGAFIEILPGKDGLCHISKLSDSRIEEISDFIKEGEKLKVKVVDIDKLGRINLSAVNID